MRHYRKQTRTETLILSEDDENNYSIASNLSPDPDMGTGLVWGIGPEQYDPAEWQECSREEAEKILGYDPEEGREEYGILS